MYKYIYKNTYIIFLLLSLSLIVLNANKILSLNLTNNIYSSIDKLFRVSTKTRKRNLCKPLQEELIAIISPHKSNWSISILNSKEELITDINGDIKRIPASNQKIYTTAYALDKLGANYFLTTDLYKNSKGHYEIKGNGDPDFNYKNIIILTSKIKQNPFYTISSPLIFLYEEDKHFWWPISWSKNDILYSYGAPITRLPLNSNSYISSLYNPLENFKYLLSETLTNQNINLKIIHKRHNNFNRFEKRSLIYSFKSLPLKSLLRISNSESHNFTSEVLLRNAANSWDNSIASKRLSFWLVNKGILKEDISIHDGSGLSRNNQTTTNSIVHILNYMNNHYLSEIYINSFSIIGIRGTLKYQYTSPYTINKFYGKTGTLTGVKAVSGYLKTNNGDKVISIIRNSNYYDSSYFTKILNAVAAESTCK